MDKCLPFGASISCALFQRVSNAIKHMAQVKTGSDLTNYLDDFLFYAITVMKCHWLMTRFIEICQEISFSIAMDKTEWASAAIVFLGILIDGRNFVLSLPLEKRNKAISLLHEMLSKHKVTVRDLQALCGYLNFLGKAVFPGRVFTHRMYAKYGKMINTGRNSGLPYVVCCKVRQHHHVRLDNEFKNDCRVWLKFLDSKLTSVVKRPMIDLKRVLSAREIRFYSDASATINLGFGCIFNKCWIFGAWGATFMMNFCQLSNIWSFSHFVQGYSHGRLNLAIVA